MCKYIIVFACLYLYAEVAAKVITPDKSKKPWTGKWFPYNPTNIPIETNECDDGKHSISIDFDPDDKRHSYNYLCLDKRIKYEPKLSTEAVIKEHQIPPAFKSPYKCINETIEYESEEPPTFGAHRIVPPKYGKYQYLPPQRWLHSLEQGAIVLLYHPCAFSGQIDALEIILKGCLYRHIITPSQRLSAKRPLALLAWGKSLQMSVVDERIVVDFIKANAKKGPVDAAHQNSLGRQYEAGLLKEARLITDENDTEICGKNIR